MISVKTHFFYTVCKYQILNIKVSLWTYNEFHSINHYYEKETSCPLSIFLHSLIFRQITGACYKKRERKMDELKMWHLTDGPNLYKPNLYTHNSKTQLHINVHHSKPQMSMPSCCVLFINEDYSQNVRDSHMFFLTFIEIDSHLYFTL